MLFGISEKLLRGIYKGKEYILGVLFIPIYVVLTFVAWIGKREVESTVSEFFVISN